MAELNCFFSALELAAARLAQLVEHQTARRDVAVSNPGRTSNKGLTIPQKKWLPLL